MMMILAVLALLVIGLAVSTPLTWLLVRAGHRVGALDSAGAAGHSKQLRSVPNIGGIAVFAAVAGPMALGLLALLILPRETIQSWLPAITDDLHARITGPSARTAWAMLACLLVLHITGLIDDRRSLNAALKLAVQLVAALVMVVFFDVRLLTLLGDVPSIIITVLWILAITNAINFLDNMDGLAGGVAAIAGALFMAAALVNHQWFIAASLALLVGGLVGFLLFNFPPAKIFMGDGGSLVVGFLLAVLTARTTFYHPDAGTDAATGLGGGWYGVFMPVIVLAIPLYDLCTVVAIRLRQGRSPFVGDQQHFSHRLVQRGMSRRGAVVMIWGATAVTGIGGISLGRLEAWQAMLVGAQTILVLLFIAMFEHASRHIARQGDRGNRGDDNERA